MKCLRTLLMVLALGPAAATPLVLNTEDAAPYNMLVNGQVVGIGADKVRLLMERAKQAYKVELLPWRRAYEDALRHANTCVFSTTRTPERETLFKWVGPLAFNEWLLFARADAAIKLGSLEEARPYLIGAYNGDVREQFLRARGFRVETVVADSLNPKKLLLGRIDLWVSGRYDGAVLIEQGGWSQQIVPVLNFHRSELYLACNPQVGDELIDRLNVMLGVINRDGSAAKIDERYASWPR